MTKPPRIYTEDLPEGSKIVARTEDGDRIVIVRDMNLTRRNAHRAAAEVLCAKK